jgi:hypothetical protein
LVPDKYPPARIVDAGPVSAMHELLDVVDVQLLSRGAASLLVEAF